MRYQPGDSIGISVRNDPALVESLLVRLGVDGSRVFSVAPVDSGVVAGGAKGGLEETNGLGHLLPHLRWPCTTRQAFSVRQES